MSAADLDRRLGELLGRRGSRPHRSLWDLAETWEQLVTACAECYQWGFDEFDNEIRVRGLIEEVLQDPEMRSFEQLVEFARRVTEADRRFFELVAEAEIRSADLPWWRRKVLRRAGDDYRDDLRDLHGIDVSPC